MYYDVLTLPTFPTIFKNGERMKMKSFDPDHPGLPGVSDEMSEGLFQSFCSTFTRGDSNFSLANSGQQQDANGFNSHHRTSSHHSWCFKYAKSKVLHGKFCTGARKLFSQELFPWHWVMLSFPNSYPATFEFLLCCKLVVLLCCFAMRSHCRVMAKEQWIFHGTWVGVGHKAAR